MLVNALQELCAVVSIEACQCVERVVCSSFTEGCQCVERVVCSSFTEACQCVERVVCSSFN